MVDHARLFAGEFSEVKSFVDNNFWHHDVEDNAYAHTNSRWQSCISAFICNTVGTPFPSRHCFDEGGDRTSGILSSSKSYGQETLTVSRKEEGSSINPSRESRYYEEDPSGGRNRQVREGDTAR